MANEFVIKNGYFSRGDSQVTGSLNVSGGITGSLLGTASFAITASHALNIPDATPTASLLRTASIDLNTITFEKGDGSTFDIIVDTGSATVIDTSSFVTNDQTSSFVTNDQTSSFVTNNQTSSFLTPADTASFVTNDQTASFLTPSDTASLVTAAITASSLVTASVSSNTITFEKGDGSTFPLTIDTGSGGVSAILTQDLTANQTVGAVSSGETFDSGSTLENLLRNILITYIEPGISSVTVRSGSNNISTGTRDVGAVFVCDNLTFNATVDDPDGNYPMSSSVTCSGADIGTFQEVGPATLVGSNTLNFSTARTITRAAGSGTVTFTVRSTSQTTSDTQNTSRSFNFRWRNYLAASSVVVSGSSTLQSVLDNDVVDDNLDTNRVWTATCDANNDTLGNFTYVIYPASYGDLSGIIQDGATPVLGAFTKLGDYTADNNQGSSQSWRVYKSNADAAFADGTSLAIS